MPLRVLLALLWGFVGHGHSPASRVDSPEPEPEPVTVDDLERWVAGEPMRGPKTRNRGAAMALLQIPRRGDVEHGTPVSGSCGLDLRSVLPVPPGPAAVFGVDSNGALHRHADARWESITADFPLPVLGRLLGYDAPTSPVELLAVGLHEQLWSLTIADTVLVDAHLVDPAADARLVDRATFRRHFDTRQCLLEEQDCLVVTVGDGQRRSLDVEPTPGASRRPLIALGPRQTLEARYADHDGEQIVLLTEHSGCDGERSPVEAPP